ncbi:hypothetical protein L1049_009157 [Liquidambar formosana]|uniref:CBM20 domain-containing protein n=1 Tax=Liquidambar formosana TaxID=63359 RepID=A0AAP0SAT6_LIQFO
METLKSSSAKIFADKYRAGGFLFSKNFTARQEIRFLKYRKRFDMGFSQLICLQHKIIHPIFSSSSSSVSPESQAASEEMETESQEIHQLKTVNVKFQLQKECLFGEQFLIVGDDPMLGAWDPSNAIPLDWSDGHVWTVELDIPVGKLVQFKFILKGKTENIAWQPGPDRVLRTWESKNTITVYEDWENAECQKIIEEGMIANQTEESTVDSEMLIVAENLTQPKEEEITNINNASTIADTISYPAEKPLAEMHNELIVAQNITHVQEKPVAMVAENITYPKEKPLLQVNNTVPGAKSITYPKEEHTATVKNPASTEDEKNPVSSEGGPILVPGLSPLSTVLTEEAPFNEDESSIAINASVGANEAKDHTLPEFKEEEEPDSDPQQEETTKMSSDEENLHVVLHNDIQWGRRTLQKLLSAFGFF